MTSSPFSPFSVIIAHYAPLNNTAKYRNLLKLTIASIRSQKYSGQVEIIVCDDGSAWSSSLAKDQRITEFNTSEIREVPQLADLEVDRYLLLPDSGGYRGVVMKDYAFRTAKFDKIIVLDDDHPFISRKALERFDRYMDKYDFVRGRIVGPTGIPQLFSSKNAQGTTYGLKREVYLRFGGYADFLYENAKGEDNDLLWQVYKTLSECYPGQIKAAYAGDIVTKDLASNRWLDRSVKTDFGINVVGAVNVDPNTVLIQKFKDRYGIHPWYNLSREKKLWMEFPSLAAYLSEIKYSFFYAVKMAPKELRGLFKRLKDNAMLLKSTQTRRILIEKVRFRLQKLYSKVQKNL